MPWSISPDIELTLWNVAKRRLPADALRGLSAAVIARSRLYTSEREGLGELLPHAASDADLAARALFFTVADAAKVAVPLAELESRGLIPRGSRARPFTILDVGAGVGAMSLGALDYLRREGHLARDTAISLRALDRDQRALSLLDEAVSELAERWGLGIEVHRERVDLADPTALLSGRAGRGADLVLAGTVLNELGETARQALVTAMIAAVHDTGAVILIEPALRETGRALHELRDFAIQHKLAHVFAPCVRRAAPCPALADEDDWCHEDRPTELPERTAQLAASTGLRTYGLKFAYLVLRKNAEGQVDVAEGQSALRVVSQVRKLKGKRECFGCGEEGRGLVRLLQRHRSDANRRLERARRGDVLLVPRELGGGGDVQREHAVGVHSVEPPE